MTHNTMRKCTQICTRRALCIQAFSTVCAQTLLASSLDIVRSMHAVVVGIESAAPWLRRHGTFCNLRANDSACCIAEVALAICGTQIS